MNITEEQLERLKNLNDSRVNEILNVLEVGQWYKDLDSKGLYYITKTKRDRFYFYGLDLNGIWTSEDLYITENCDLIKATKKEVEYALITEAKRREYKNGNYKCLYSYTMEVEDKYFLDEKNCFWHGVKGSANLVFENGQWAEIIDEKNELTFEEYQKLSVRTCNDLGNTTSNDTHMIFGMVTEVAELADAYKKHWAYGKELDMVNVKEELGDLLFYISNFAKFNNINLGEIMYTNVEKLKARYPEKFTNENATNRDLETERQILENGH